MAWPTPQDYNEAVQNPRVCFLDRELKLGRPEVNELGLPLAATGAFASVYRLRCPKRDWAIRLFLRDVADQKPRYHEISRFIMTDDLVYTVWFEYMQQGIKVGGIWYPALKMEWVDGQTMDSYIHENIDNREALQLLYERFCILAKRLKEAGIAHGDLQHGNIMVLSDDLRLVDYDGMFVPTLAGHPASELGHPNYQHPARSGSHFGPFLDNFSVWVIRNSLMAIIDSPEIWHKVCGGDECLLFRRADYANPLQSPTFSYLEGHESEVVRRCAKQLRALLNYGPDAIPELDEEVELDSLPPLDVIEGDYERTPTIEITTDWSFKTPWYLRARTEATVFLHEEEQQQPTEQMAGMPGIQGIPGDPGAQGMALQRRPWPRPWEYSQAVSTAGRFKDPELLTARCNYGKRVAGDNGVIYQFYSDKRKWAVKLFWHHVPDREIRYINLAKQLTGGLKSRYFTNFEYQREGIEVNGIWYPLLKMDWIEGVTLDRFLGEHLRANDQLMLEELRERFSQMIQALSTRKIAHGNLDHSNIIVVGADYRPDFKLVDYDTMFYEQLRGCYCPEVGNPLYQHPERGHSFFNPQMDNFSAWMIDSFFLHLFTTRQWHAGGWDRFVKRVRPYKTPGKGFMKLIAGDRYLGYDIGDVSELSGESLKYKGRLKMRRKLLRKFIDTPIEYIPGLSPDGDRAAFAWIKEKAQIAQGQRP